MLQHVVADQDPHHLLNENSQALSIITHAIKENTIQAKQLFFSTVSVFSNTIIEHDTRQATFGQHKGSNSLILREYIHKCNFRTWHKGSNSLFLSKYIHICKFRK